MLTKVAKGIAFGDVSNAAVRNILTEISRQVYGKFTEQEMLDTMEYFDWKCPYTGKDLRGAIENGSGEYATDHIYPQNKEYCGLNIKGNLVLVYKAANAEKGSRPIEEFLFDESVKVLKGVDQEMRKERLDKIKEFQKECGYDPEKIRNTLKSLLEDRYTKIREEQEECIKKAIDATGMKALNFKDSTTPSTKTSKKRTVPEIVLVPENELDFKRELIKSKFATFILTYDSGAIKTSPWKAENFDNNSNLRANIQSRPFWRNKTKDGLIKVEVHIGNERV